MPKPPEPAAEQRAAGDCDTASLSNVAPRSSWQLQNNVVQDGDVFFLGRVGALRSTSKKSTSSPRGYHASLGMSESSEPEALPTEGGCLAWLHAWEVRQEKLLRRHEEAMRQQVEALRRDVLKGERRMPKARLTPTSSTSSLHLGMHMPSEKSRKWWSEGTNRMGPAMSTTLSMAAMSQAPSLGRSSATQHQEGRMVTMPTNQSEKTWGSSPRKTRTAERPKVGPRAWVFTLVHSHFFAICTSLMIFLYTIAVGIMAESEMSSALENQPVPLWLFYVDAFFASSFSLEVVLRIVSDGRNYFTGPERWWNIFDSAVAAVGIGDLGLGKQLNLGFFRILRFFRVIRVIRVIRHIHALRDLRMMAESLCACVPCLGWGLVLLGSLEYIMAVVLLRGTHQHVREGQLSEYSQRMMRSSFCGISSAMYSLTEAISGGRSWGEFALPFKEVNPIYGACFAAFMCFVIFGALNILTGIFVETTNSIAKQNKELAVEEEISKAEYAEAQIRDFFEDLDTDCSGTISHEELKVGLQDPRVKAYFAVLQIDAQDSQSLFHLMDKDHSGEVNIEEFIERCLKLRGGAMAMDIAAVRRENCMMNKQFKMLMKRIDEVSQNLQPDASV